MAKQCPPGVICIENMTIIFFIIISLASLYIIYLISKQNNLQNEKKYTINIENKGDDRENTQTGLFSRPGNSYSNIENDVLLNPYQAPLRDNRIFPNLNMNTMSGKMPINVPTQSFDTTYRQIGLLTRIGGTETMLPLLGRPLITNRDKWNFYTISENNNLLKLPISHKGRKCMSEYGCDDLYNGDTVIVDGYNDSFKVTTYENNLPQYIPYL